MRNLMMGLAFAALFALLLAAEVVSPYQYDCRMIRHMVARGETVWEIAANYMDKQDKIRDIREMVWHIRETNKLKSCLICPGDVVMVPLWTKK